MKSRLFVALSFIFLAVCPHATAENFSQPVHILPDRYLRYGLDTPLPRLTNPSVSRQRFAETPEIQMLRQNAQKMTDEMQSFIAFYHEEMGSGQTKNKTSQYEIQVIDGSQTYKDLASKKSKKNNQLECQEETGLKPGSQWAELPKMIGSELKLRIQKFEDIYLPEYGKLMVFRYEVSAEDEVVFFSTCTDYFFFKEWKTFYVAARGEVWTDDQPNIARITMELHLPKDTKWTNIRLSMLYGWLASPNSGQIRLVPTRIFFEGNLNGQTYWTDGHFTKYRQFVSNVKIRP